MSDTVLSPTQTTDHVPADDTPRLGEPVTPTLPTVAPADPAPTIADSAPTLPAVTPALPESAPVAPAPAPSEEPAPPMPTLPDPVSTNAPASAVGEQEPAEPRHPMANLMPEKSKPTEASLRAAEIRAAQKAKGRKIKIGIAAGALVFAGVVGPPTYKWTANAINEAGNTSTETVDD